MTSETPPTLQRLCVAPVRFRRRCARAEQGADGTDEGRWYVSTRVDQDRRLLLDRLVEKSPAVARTPSSLANISRYLLTPAVVEAAQLLDPDPTTGEFMITSAIQTVSLHSRVGVSVAEGRYFDCGSADGWLAANVATAETNA